MRWGLVVIVCVVLSWVVPVWGATSPVSEAQDDEVNVTSTIISNAQVQAIGCYNGYEQNPHTSCLLNHVFDLTKPFHTKKKWIFLITQAPNNTSGPYENPSNNGIINFCFLKDDVSSCKYTGFNAYPHTGWLAGKNDILNTVFSAAIMYPTKTAYYPILVVIAGQLNGGPGSAIIRTLIWAYRPKTEKFEQIWYMASLGNRNEETRVFSGGPLAGDIVVASNNATGRWPWPYGIDVYRLTPSMHYVRILHFIGKSAQVGGPPGAVIDADMPEILARLGLQGH